MITASQRLYIRPESDHKPLPFPSRPLGPETSSHPRKHHDSPHASVAHPGAFLPPSSSPSPVLRLPLRLSRPAHPRPPLRRPHLQLHPTQAPPLSSQHRVSHPSAFFPAGRKRMLIGAASRRGPRHARPPSRERACLSLPCLPAPTRT